MPIPFEEIPSNLLVPLFYAEVRGAQTPYNSSLKCMFIGNKTSGKSADVNTPILLSQEIAEQQFGRGSMLEAMFRRAKENGPFNEYWGMTPSEDLDAVPASGTIEVVNTANKDGVIAFWIAGYKVDFVVRTTHTRAQIASKLVSAINSRGFMPVRAALDPGDTEVVIVTVKWAAQSGNSVDIKLEPFGSPQTQAQRCLNYTQISGGVGDSNLASCFAAVGGMRFDVIGLGPDPRFGQIAQSRDFMNHTDGRWSPYQQQFGHIFCTNRQAWSDAVTFLSVFNEPHVTVLNPGLTPTPPWEMTGAVCARVTQHWANPPELSRPLQSLQLNGCRPPWNPTDWFDISERQSLLEAGGSTVRYDDDRTVRIDRLVTLYKTNVWGDPDASWRDAITMFQAMYFVRAMRAAITGAFPRAALTDEDTGIEGFASPGRIMDVILHEYKRLQGLGLVENHKLFAEALVVERNAIDANRVDVLARPDMVNQLRIVAFLAETHLQLQDSSLFDTAGEIPA